jgi:hypothetical protein
MPLLYLMGASRGALVSADFRPNYRRYSDIVEGSLRAVPQWVKVAAGTRYTGDLRLSIPYRVATLPEFIVEGRTNVVAFLANPLHSRAWGFQHPYRRAIECHRIGRIAMVVKYWTERPLSLRGHERDGVPKRRKVREQMDVLTVVHGEWPMCGVYDQLGSTYVSSGYKPVDIIAFRKSNVTRMPMYGV